MATEPTKSGAVRPAATLLLLRPGGDGGFEIFMMVRHYEIDFNAGALVFPGGSVDAGDHEIADASIANGNDVRDKAALAFRIAAIRETFEESGILLARRRGAAVLLSGNEASAISAAHRLAVCEGKTSFAQVLAQHDLVLALDTLIPFAHWITPEGVPKRFDTHFFLAAAPPEQIGAHDGRESTDSLWLSPREALDGAQSGRFKLPFPTTRNLIKLGKHADVASVLAAAQQDRVVTVMPVVTRDGDKRWLRIPAEAGYDGAVFEVPARG